MNKPPGQCRVPKCKEVTPAYGFFAADFLNFYEKM